MEDNVEKLKGMLARHDWTYMMSDDSRAYGAGHKSLIEIRAVIALVGEEGKELYHEAYIEAWGT